MRTDKLKMDDGFTYCCKAIPIKTIEVENGAILNKKTREIHRKRVHLYKHYIQDGKILDEPVCDEDVYLVLGVEK